jgi:hypothetical protein
MTDPRTLALPLAFIILAGLLCWYVITAKGKLLIKLVLIFAVPSFGLVTWHAMDSYLGWPTTYSPSGQNLLLWMQIREPNKRAADPGAIYVWLVPLEEQEKEGRTFLATPTATANRAPTSSSTRAARTSS